MELRRRLTRILAVVAGCVVVLAAAAWLGLRVASRPLAGPPLEGSVPDTVALPDGLPEPVGRFYRRLYGARVPVVDTAVISGRGTMRVSGVKMQARFRFTHDTGEGYRHYIETTWFGSRLFRVDETYLEGSARLELPVGVSEGPNVDQGANLALWAEAVWMPSVWVTDPTVRWEPVDGHTAALVVPFGDDEQTLIARFDPDTGMLRLLESMRSRGEDDESMVLWINEVTDWGEVEGHPVPLHTTVTWFDEGSPWAELTTESVVYGADLEGYLDARGP